MNYYDLRLDILDLFAEAHRQHYSWRGDRYTVADGGFRAFAPDDRETEKHNFVAKRRIKTLDDYRRRLLAGERPRGLNIKAWQQAAESLGICLLPTQPKARAA